MHVFSLINKAFTVIKRDTDKDRCAVFIDTRAAGTYVTAAHNYSVYATVQWQGKDSPSVLPDEDWPVHDFLDLDFVRDAAKASYREIDEDDVLSMYAEDTEELRMVANAVETIDYEPLDKIQSIEGVDIFAPLTKSKGIKKLLRSRSNLQQAYVCEDLLCFTTGHWLVQKSVDSGVDVATIPFTVLEIMQAWRGKVEWLYASSDQKEVRFHGICAEGGLVTLSYYNTKEKGPNVSAIAKEFSPASFFRVPADELFRFVTKIGKSFGQEDTIYFTYKEEEGAELFLSTTEVTPDNEEVLRKKHTTIDCDLMGDASRIKDGRFRSAWKAIYLTTCLNAVGELVEFIVPIAEDGSGNKPCSFIGEDADALVMPKRL
jgi:hypothetical protein